MMKIKKNIFLVGRGKHCSPEMRNLIIKLKNGGKTYTKIENILGCSSTMIFNAIHYNQEFRPKFTKKTVKHGGLSI